MRAASGRQARQRWKRERDRGGSPWLLGLCRGSVPQRSQRRKEVWGHVPAVSLPLRVSRGALQGAPPPRPGFLQGGGWCSLEGKMVTLAGFPQ